MSRSIHIKDHAGIPQITNIAEYIRLKEVRANTSLINGQIIYANRVWPVDLYEKTFPKPTLKYSSLQIVKGQVER